MFEELHHRIPCLAWLLLLGVIAAGSGCARTRANTVPAGPPLDVPAPPPRIVVPLQVEADVPEPEPEVPQEPVRPPARPRAAAPASDLPARPADVPKVVDEVPRPPSTAPPTTLQTTPAAEQGEVERAIRATMGRAGGDLNRIDYRALNADARTQYDTAKRFIEQAEEALRMKNLLFAKNLADKAAVLATQLSAR
jgi:hypothetical protein